MRPPDLLPVMLGRLAYWVARGVVATIQSLPLTWVARGGRFAGGIAFLLDARHRRVATHNLKASLGDRLTEDGIRTCVRENFMRIGENMACAVKTASMSASALRPHLEFANTGHVADWLARNPKGCMVAAIGHFGNFELYARAGDAFPGLKTATTYRGLPSPHLNRLAQDLRASSGCLYFERRTEGTALRHLMDEGGCMLGLMGDQHAGDRGLPLPFFGRTCSTSPAPAVFAHRYGAALFVAICHRVGLARWRLELSPFVSTHLDGEPRETADIMRDVNRLYEDAIRRDPANWFWVHKRWKPGKHRKQLDPTRSPRSDAGSGKGPVEAS